jgi:hypothetical protein
LKKEKPWKNPEAGLPWFVIRSSFPLQISSCGRRLGKAVKPKEIAIKGSVKGHLCSPSSKLADFKRETHLNARTL